MWRVPLFVAGVGSVGSAALWCSERSDRLVPDLFGGDRDQFAAGIAQGGQASAEDAAGVQADGVVDPLGPSGGSVAVDDHGRAPVALGPGMADGKAVLDRKSTRLNSS